MVTEGERAASADSSRAVGERSCERAANRVFSTEIARISVRATPAAANCSGLEVARRLAITSPYTV
jgi:hypothetical protein